MTKVFKMSPLALMRGTSCAIKIMLDCPLDFLGKDIEKKVKDTLEKYCKDMVVKAVASHCVEENQK